MHMKYQRPRRKSRTTDPISNISVEALTDEQRGRAFRRLAKELIRHSPSGPPLDFKIA